MEAGLGDKVYRVLETRPRVLVNSLLVGRAKWKEKCAAAKIELQAFRGKVRDLEVSRGEVANPGRRNREPPTRSGAATGVSERAEQAA
jgi:hypothetical protein